jgi:hypothetical protein
VKPSRRRALPNSGVNQSIGTFLAGLEQKILHNRPPAAVVVEEDQRGLQTSNGLVLDPANEPIERPEPPDRSGARL